MGIKYGRGWGGARISLSRGSVLSREYFPSSYFHATWLSSDCCLLPYFTFCLLQKLWENAASKYTGIVCRIFLHRFHRLTSHHSHHPSPLHAEIGFVGLNFCKTEFLYAWQRYKCCRRWCCCGHHRVAPTSCCGVSIWCNRNSHTICWMDATAKINSLTHISASDSFSRFWRYINLYVCMYVCGVGSV